MTSEFLKVLGNLKGVRNMGPGLTLGMALGYSIFFTVVLLFSSCIDKTARPNPFGMPGMVPPYVPPQMLNIPQTSLQAKPAVRYPLNQVSAVDLGYEFKKKTLD